MSGVVKVVQEGDFMGVVADTRAQAYAAVAAVEALWDEGKLWTQEEIDAMLVPEGNDGIVIQKEGDAEAQLKQETTLRSEYLSPFAIQTPLEAQAALAEVVDGKAKVWVSTQMQSAVLPVVAEATGLDEENIEVIPTYLGGGFGRKSGFESAGEAARLAKASGVPVHVGWNRTEELRYGYFRPPTHSILSGRLDDNGKMVALEHSQASGDVAADFVPSFLTAMMGADFGAVRGARIHYDAVPNIKTLAYRRPLPVRTGWWRGLGLLANNYAIESFVDEMAIAAGKDPVQFRIDHLGESTDQQRLRRVIEKVAEMADWGSPAPEGRGRGIACIADVGTMVAEIAEVSVDATSGVIRVHNFWAAMDCGLTVNPDGARAQVEGNVMWGVGSSLLEEMRVENGRIPVGNFDTYPLLTMKQAPHVEVELLEAGDGIPRGVGEPPIAPVAAAVANAFFALTGKRLRQIPFTPERVMAALTA
jgi:isoquinoline 1-oxidoreductase beta subunit